MSGGKNNKDNQQKKVVTEESLVRSIAEKKLKVEEELSLYKLSANHLRMLTSEYDKSEGRYKNDPSEENAERLAESKWSLSEAASAFKEISENLNLYVAEVNADYIALEDILSSQKTDNTDKIEKISKECNKYSMKVAKEIANVENNTPEVQVETEEKAVENTAAEEPVKAVPVNQVKIAPISLDITDIVERAVSVTMQKFVSTFDKRMDAFLAENPVKEGAAVPVVSGSNGVVALEAAVLDDEQKIAEKLATIVETLKTVSAKVADLSAACMELSAKQGTANDMQKQTNDMQRQTMREQKGIQVSQRVLGQDQVAVVEAQTLLAEQQKAMIERQEALAAAQSAMEETHRAIIENQSALEEAMKTVMQSQKEIILAQQAIINGTNKNASAQAEITERQAETLSLAKSALTQQKQILREQRAFNEKQNSLVTGAKNGAKKTEAAE